MSSESLKNLLRRLEQLQVCAGQPDDRFVNMCSQKKGVFRNRQGQTVAYLDKYAPVTFNQQLFEETVRTSQCEMLVPGKAKCKSCKLYRHSLRTMYSRWLKRSSSVTDSDSHANIRYLNTPEKKQRISHLKKRVGSAEAKVERLKKQIERLNETQGIHISDELGNDLVQIMTENREEINRAYSKDSFAHLFWSEQLKAVTCKDSRQVRWHPLIIRWCINLKLMSSSAYHAMRSTGFLKLPSERTLRDYTNYFKHQTGYQPEVIRELQQEAKLESLPENRKFCSIVVDEMRVREGLVFDKNSGDIVGFSASGSINDELERIEREIDGIHDKPAVAKHMLVIMVRGLLFKLNFPLAHFATVDLTGEQLFPIVWEGVQTVESIGLKVLCIVADGASPNRKFFRMHKESQPPRQRSSASASTCASSTASATTTPLLASLLAAPVSTRVSSTDASTHKQSSTKEITYRTKNPYSIDGERYIYFISDPPHLIKTTRNCFNNSSVNGTRRMAVSNKFDIEFYLLIFYLPLCREMESSLSGPTSENCMTRHMGWLHDLVG